MLEGTRPPDVDLALNLELDAADKALLLVALPVLFDVDPNAVRPTIEALNFQTDSPHHFIRFVLDSFR
jgi:hypothetical protein